VKIKRAATPRDRLQALARFAGGFAAQGFVFGAWHNPLPDDAGVLEFPYFELSPEASTFVEFAYEFGWVRSFNWSTWRETEEGKRLMARPEQVATATEEQLAKVLTVIFRGDRFSEGALFAAFEAGFLTAIVQRAEALLRPEFHTAQVGESAGPKTTDRHQNRRVQMENNEWTVRLQEHYKIKTGKTTRARLPGPNAIAICGDSKRIVITMSDRGLLANMATDEAAFEGWALALRTWCDVEKIALAWDVPSRDVCHPQYQRFLYRAFRFRELFGDWFEVSKSDNEWVPSAKALRGGPLLLNEPGTRGLPGENRAPAAEDERSKAEDKIASEVRPMPLLEAALELLLYSSKAFRAHFELSQVDRQRPVGLFSDTVSEKTRIFTGGASAIDLIGFANETLSIFELKKPGNTRVGALSELFFYAAVIRDVAGPKAPFKFSGAPSTVGTTVHSVDIRKCTQIKAVLLHHDIHPLLADPHVFGCINAAVRKHWDTVPGRVPVIFSTAAYSIENGKDFSFEKTTT
jgi:hypothetical protein